MPGKSSFQEGDAFLVDQVFIVFGHFGLREIVREAQFSLGERRGEHDVDPLGARFKIVGEEAELLQVGDARYAQLFSLRGVEFV